MTREQIIAKLMPVMHDTFDDDDIVYRDDLTAAEVADWDSLSNIRFMVAVEQAFGTRLSTAKIEGLRKLGDLVDLLEKRR
jgi:acyl carrier protein